MSEKTQQTMKPSTAAKKLEVYLPATPTEFQEGLVTRDEYDELLANPPQWLTDLRATGPHPRPVIAAKLGISISGLVRSGVTEALTTAEIKDLLTDRPAWLVEERAIQAEVRNEQIRVKNAAKDAQERE
jgi:Family of unknown function (DUF5997)